MTLKDLLDSNATTIANLKVLNHRNKVVYNSIYTNIISESIILDMKVAFWKIFVNSSNTYFDMLVVLKGSNFN